MGINCYRFELKPYKRTLKGLTNARGDIPQQGGRWLRLQRDGDGRVGFGEMVSLQGFGVESLEEVDQFCYSLKGCIKEDEIFSIPPNLSVTRSGFESAWRNLDSISARPHRYFSVVALLPNGEKGLKTIINKKKEGFLFFKWKIGINKFSEEKAIFSQLYKHLSQNGKIRLDANGSLDEKLGHQWLSFLENYPLVDFLEQPLKPDKLHLMQKWTEEFSTPLALDESIASSDSLKDLDWNGVYVIKPSLLGEWNSFIPWARERKKEIVFSTAFESAVGVDNILKLAEDVDLVRPIGFGVSDYLPATDRKYHGVKPYIKQYLEYNQIDSFFAKKENSLGCI